MKYDAKKHWAIDFEIVADDTNLSSSQIIWCVRKIYKAVSAGGNACGVAPQIGSEHFHIIEVWANADCNLALLFQVVSEMCRQGCYLDAEGKTRAETDSLMNLGYALQHVK